MPIAEVWCTAVEQKLVTTCSAATVVVHDKVEAMKKPELVSEIVKKTQLSKTDAEAALNAFVETITATVAGEHALV
eukprot:15223-Heterococcus_DN1.PRE.1